MNGRCETDPLDRAEDICSVCGGQFCPNCLVHPRGTTKPPTCKACAFANSGLRGSKSDGKGISKRQWKKLRAQLAEELEASPEEEAPVIEFFDLQEKVDDPVLRRVPPADDEGESEADPVTETDLAGAISGLPPVDDPPPAEREPPPSQAVSPAPPAPTPDDAASLGPISLDVDPLAQAPEASAPAADPIDAPAPPPPPPTGPAPESAPPSPFDQPVAVDATPESAAELLARLKADEPIASQYRAPEQQPPPAAGRPDLAVDPFGGASTPPPGHAPAASTLPDPFATAPVEPAPSPTERSSPFPSAEPTPSTTPRSTWTPPTPPPRGTALDDMANGAAPPPAPSFEAPPAPAPTPQPPIADPPIPDPPRSEPLSPSPAQGTPTPEPPPALTFNRRTDDATPAAVQFDPLTSDNGNEPAPDPASAADTDASGNWIPPILRGMAPTEEREAVPLPRRRG